MVRHDVLHGDCSIGVFKLQNMSLCCVFSCHIEMDNCSPDISFVLSCDVVVVLKDHVILGLSCL